MFGSQEKNMEESFHTIKKTDKTLKQLKFNDKLNQLKVEEIGQRGKVAKASVMTYLVNLFKNSGQGPRSGHRKHPLPCYVHCKG